VFVGAIGKIVQKNYRTKYMMDLVTYPNSEYIYPGILAALPFFFLAISMRRGDFSSKRFIKLMLISILSVYSLQAILLSISLAKYFLA
jgi:hypothetical protein